MNYSTVHYSSDNTPYYIVPTTSENTNENTNENTSENATPSNTVSTNLNEPIQTYNIKYEPVKAYTYVYPNNDKYDKLYKNYTNIKHLYLNSVNQLKSVKNNLARYIEEYDSLKTEFNNTMSIQKKLYKELETKIDEIYNLQTEINALKTTNNVLLPCKSDDTYNETYDEFNDESYWKNINLDKLELDAYVKVNNRQTAEITKLKNTIKLTRKYSKKLLKENKKYRKYFSKNNKESKFESLYYQSFLSRNKNSDYLIKDDFKYSDEFLFRNCCLNILYGSITSYCTFTPETTDYNLNYWDLYSEEQCEIIVTCLYFNYSKCLDFANYIDTADRSLSYLEQLKQIVSWLFG